MKALITGASGQVGVALTRSAPAGIAIAAFSRGELDVTDAPTVRRFISQHKPDVIINSAAYTAVDRAESDVETAHHVNVDGPRNLALAARESDARLIHISTDFVFDGASATAYAPESPTHPLGVYGRTKREGELAVLDVLPEQSIVLRTAWVYSATGSNFLRTMLRLMAANKVVRVVADQIGTPTAAGSVAEAIWKVALQPDFKGIAHWTDAGVASWYDFAVAIAEEGASCGLLPRGVSVVPIRTQDFPTAARRPAFSVLDKSALVQAGLLPIHWRQKLRETLKECAHA